jgi:hypothetical protein
MRNKSKSFFAVATLFPVFAVFLWLAHASAQAPQQSAENAFRPAEVISASDAQYPLQTVADDVVIFDVAVNDRGEVVGTTLLRDVPTLTAAAEASLQSWKFSPASRNDKPENSEMLVAFVFRHAVKVADLAPFTPVFPTYESRAGSLKGFLPAGILAVAYADYPSSTIAAGATVVQATVNEAGGTSDVKVVRELGGGFAPLAISAAKEWEFQSAMLDGKPVPSSVAIAFVFSSRSLNPF